MNIQNGNLRTITLAFMLTLGLMGNLAGQCTEKKVGLDQTKDWNEIISAFQRYWDFPSLENAKSLLTILPVDWPAELAKSSGEAIDLIIAPETYGILSTEALAGNSYSAEILIRLLAITDGYATTLIEGTLGVIIRVNPTLFLSSLWPYRDKAFIKKVRYAVAGPGYAYNNHSSAFRFDLLKRIESLETVMDKNFADIKEACIKSIRDELGRLGQGRR